MLSEISIPGVPDTVTYILLFTLAPALLALICVVAILSATWRDRKGSFKLNLPFSASVEVSVGDKEDKSPASVKGP